jgi:hypothetical protein
MEKGCDRFRLPTGAADEFHGGDGRDRPSWPASPQLGPADVEHEVNESSGSLVIP